MREYIMEWSAEERRNPLVTIDEIIEKFYATTVCKYLLLRPIPKKVLDKLKQSENLTFLWDYDLAERGSLNFLELPSWVGLAKINDDCTVAELEAEYYSWTQYPVGTILVTENANLNQTTKQYYLDFVDGPLSPMSFFNVLFAEGGGDP